MKKESELTGMDSSVVIWGWRRWVEAEETIEGLNGDGKKKIKFNFTNKNSKTKNQN